LHDCEELHNDLRRRADKHLALSGLLGVVDGVKRIVEDGSLDYKTRIRQHSEHIRLTRCDNIPMVAVVLAVSVRRDRLAFRSLEHGECLLQMPVEEVLPAQYRRGEAYQDVA
jgi:hypothetical protein